MRSIRTVSFLNVSVLSSNYVGKTAADLRVQSRMTAAKALSTSTKRGRSCHAAKDVSLVSLATFVIWSGILTAGIVGISFPLQLQSDIRKNKPPPVQAEVLQVELTDRPILNVGDSVPSPAPDSPGTAAMLQDIPPLPAVAEPAPAIAFALPVKGPVRIVEPQAAIYHRPAVHVKSDNVVRKGAAGSTSTGEGVKPASAQQLVWGRGEGKQPAPEYPRRAVLEGQEGVVVVRFTVGERGRVLGAESIKPSPWKLLNEAAVRTIRDRWQFKPGLSRLFEVSIRFRLED